MDKFDLHQYLLELDASKSINDCPRVPRPAIQENQNYIFISYSHADYKAVYAALAYMYVSGVRFWYDYALTAGRDWEIEAKEKLRNTNCSGAVLFLSENLFLSTSVIKVELPCILGVDEKGNAIPNLSSLNYFCVNLTRQSPGDVIFDVMPILRQRGHGTSWLRLLSTAFPDEITYVSSYSNDYANTMIEQIRLNFNVIDATDDSSHIQQWIDSHMAYNISGQWYHAIWDYESQRFRIGTIWIEQEFSPQKYMDLRLFGEIHYANYYDTSKGDFCTRPVSYITGECSLDDSGACTGIIYSRRRPQEQFEFKKVNKDDYRSIIDLTVNVIPPNMHTTYIPGEIHEMNENKTLYIYLFREIHTRNDYLLKNMSDVIEVK